MSVVVRIVLGLYTYAYKNKHHNIGNKIRQRVNSIGNHCRAMAQHACYELENQQRNITCAAHKSHFIYFLFPFHSCDIYLLRLQKYKTLVTF